MCRGRGGKSDLVMGVREGIPGKVILEIKLEKYIQMNRKKGGESILRQQQRRRGSREHDEFKKLIHPSWLDFGKREGDLFVNLLFFHQYSQVRSCYSIFVYSLLVLVSM